ncbi:YfgM family protein [Aerolutibacter ruishenii]|uniref:Ancillary SecYEG translocon subunit n=1 Tax=Aerolutibacter ruishenii TaxID=686800 RepID=A0A562LVB3_9GAMM|nr:tetratricopeptide repeat protein [Lysobacter ruishenii]TWI11581.1 putative negative regulator of RcsB-dependent stress response [Lysobacter ruishenii]
MAIDELLDEHEQSERVREWLRRNSGALIGGIALGLAAIGGWKWWENHQAQQKAQQADAYQVAVDAAKAGNAQAPAKVKALDGTYAVLASLELAKSQVEAKQVDAAIATLRAARTTDAALAQVVNERLARLLIGKGKADEALKLVASLDAPGALEVRGDAHLALGQHEKAREAYGQALTRLAVGSPQRGLLELKLSEVGGAPNSSEAKS